MFEIRIHGRGGQGSVTLAELITVAAFHDGKPSQGFPNFGVERRGAPVEAYVRISNEFIRLRSQVYEPDYLIVQDDSLFNGTDVFKGVKKGGLALINSKKSAGEFKNECGIKIITIDAVALALAAIGKPIINTVMLGAFARLASDGKPRQAGLISLKAAERAIRERFSGELAEKNVEAVRAGFKIVKSS